MLQDSRTVVDDPMIECAPFRLRTGVTEQELLEASAAIQRDFLDRQPGFLRRELVRSDDGLWSDVVHWSDAGSAHAAVEAAASSPVCHRYFHLMAGADGGAEPGEGLVLMRRLREYHSPHGR
jgi:hypothetical protein